MNEPQQTPLIDLLRSVPIAHRTEWETQWAEDGTPTGHALSPIGKHCHDAADKIEELEAKLDEATKAGRKVTSTLFNTMNNLTEAEERLDTIADAVMESGRYRGAGDDLRDTIKAILEQE